MTPTMAWLREPEFVAAASMGVHPHADNPGHGHMNSTPSWRRFVPPFRVRRLSPR
ncbi:hypothetical protein AB0425_15315 [Actinosynnema sp. NPDC051121]